MRQNLVILKIVKYIVEEAKMNVEVWDVYGETPLHKASVFGRLEIVKYLVEEMKKNPEIRDAYGNTPLHHASYGGHLEIVKYLVEECKVYTESQDKYGDTPLHHVSRQGYFEIVKYFIQHDLDTSMKNGGGETFLDFLKGEEIEKMIEDLHWRKSNVKSRRS